MRLQREPSHCFPRLLTDEFLNTLCIQAFKEFADSWAQLRVTQSQGKRDTQREMERGKERKRCGGEEGEERWEKLED